MSGKLVTKLANVKEGTEIEERPVFRATRFEPDSVGDRVHVPSLNLEHFKANPVALYSHKRDTPIGYWEFAIVGEGESAELHVTPVFANTTKAREAKQLVKDRALRAVSIGFRPDPEQTKENEFGGMDYHNATLVEVSLVSMPALHSAIRVKGQNMKTSMKKKEDGQENPLDRLEALLARLEAVVVSLEAKNAEDEEEKEDDEDEEMDSEEIEESEDEEEKALAALLAILK